MRPQRRKRSAVEPLGISEAIVTLHRQQIAFPARHALASDKSLRRKCVRDLNDDLPRDPRQHTGKRLRCALSEGGQGTLEGFGSRADVAALECELTDLAADARS